MVRRSITHSAAVLVVVVISCCRSHGAHLKLAIPGTKAPAKKKKHAPVLDTSRGYIEALQSSQPSVAVCFTGQLRTFFMPLVQAGLESNFHHPRYEYFLSVDTDPFSKKNKRSGGSETIMKSIRGRSNMNSKAHTVTYGPAKCQPHSQMDTVMFPMVARYVACYSAIEAEESRRGFSYDFVARIRPDTMFFKTFPRIDIAFAEFGMGANIVIWDDQMGIAARSHAGAIFLSPVMAFITCGNGPEWVRVCNGSIFNQYLPLPRSSAEWANKDFDGPPCEPMKRLMAFEHESTSLKHCGFIEYGACHKACMMGIIRSSLQSREPQCSASFYKHENQSEVSAYLSLLQSRSPHSRPFMEQRNYIGKPGRSHNLEVFRVGVCVHGPVHDSFTSRHLAPFLAKQNTKEYDFFISSNFENSNILNIDNPTENNVKDFFYKNTEIKASGKCASGVELHDALYAVTCFNEVLVYETAHNFKYEFIVSVAMDKIHHIASVDIAHIASLHFTDIRENSAVVLVDDFMVLGERASSGALIFLGPWEALQVCPSDHETNLTRGLCSNHSNLCSKFMRAYTHLGESACSLVREMRLVDSTPNATTVLNVSLCEMGL
jgi:hypothetical protein